MNPPPKKFSSLFSIFLLLFLLTGTAFAQTGSIVGQITNTDQQPVAHINISLEGTHFGSAANKKGYYAIKHIPASEYTLVISGVGYQTQKKSITVESGKTLTINVILVSSSEALEEIVVAANQINKFATPVSAYVSKLPIKNIDNPQVYNTVGSALLEDQMVTSFAEALTNAPGIFKLWESTGRGGDGAGYYSLRGFAVQPTMVNGLPSLTNGTLDVSNVERIEVIKGPSGALYGSSLISYGGLINVVTEKPYNRFGGEIAYKTGSFGLNRITADINTPISDEEDIALRVNGAYHNENSFQDAGFHKSLFIAPSLSYDVNDRLSFLINTEYYQSEGTNPTMLFLNRNTPLVASNIKELNYDYNNSYTSNALTISNPAFSLQGQMKYQISDHWTSQTALSRSSAKADGYYSYLWDMADGNGTYTRYISKQNSTTLGTDIQQNFIGDFTIAGLHNKMVIGADYFSQRLINNSSGYIAFDQISLRDSDPAGLSRAAVDTALAGAAVNNVTTEQRTYSAYISDVIEFTPRLSAMASLRIDHFDNRGDLASEEDNYFQTALSPKFGLVFQPIDDKISLFANYMNGFSNVAPRIQDDGSTKTFSPEQANQWETGVKTYLVNGRVTATVSYYNITVSNVVRPDPERVGFYIQDGENYSRGFEASITAEPVPGLNIIAGYSHNESEITKTGNDTYRGRRPEAAGPQDLFNTWASYYITNGALKGFGVGLGANYASENLTLNRTTTGVFTLPSYTIFDASIFYNTGSYRIDLKVNNLTDEKYYKGWNTVNPQQPRSITAGFSYKF